MSGRKQSWNLRCGGAVDSPVLEDSLQLLLHAHGVELVHVSRHPGGSGGSWFGRLIWTGPSLSTRAELPWRRPLFEWARSLELDLLLLPGERDLREAPLLCAFDGDGTLFDGETIDELAELAGRGEKVAALTAAAMRGELDFETALRERVRTLAGLPLERLEEIDARLPLQPGTRECLVRLGESGAWLALFTGGFHFFADRRAAELGIRTCRANRLASSDGVLTGELTGAIVDARAKAAALREACERRGIGVDRSMACGDGANDLPMLDAAGLAVGFRPKDILLDRLDGALFRGDWRALPPLLGL